MFGSPGTLPVLQLKPHVLCCVMVHSWQCLCFCFVPCVFLQDHCLIRSPTGGVDEEVVVFLSHLKKVEMPSRDNLSPSLIATICEGLCSSNSMEGTSDDIRVRVLSVSLTTPYKLLSCVSKLPFKAIYTSSTTLNRWQPFLSLRWAPMMLYDCLVHTVLCSLQLSSLQFCILWSSLRHCVLHYVVFYVLSRVLVYYWDEWCCHSRLSWWRM